MRASNSTGLSLPKWQIALAVGAPVAIGLGIWYYRSRKSVKNFSVDETKIETPVQTTKGEGQQVDKIPVVTTTSETSQPVSQAPKEQEETDPFKKSQIFKNKGNKHFKEGKYADAIKCYRQAIEVCPQTKTTDLSTFYQNRAAAYEQLVRHLLNLTIPANSD